MLFSNTKSKIPKQLSVAPNKKKKDFQKCIVELRSTLHARHRVIHHTQKRNHSRTNLYIFDHAPYMLFTCANTHTHECICNVNVWSVAWFCIFVFRCCSATISRYCCAMLFLERTLLFFVVVFFYYFCMQLNFRSGFLCVITDYVFCCWLFVCLSCCSLCLSHTLTRFCSFCTVYREIKVPRTKYESKLQCATMYTVLRVVCVWTRVKITTKYNCQIFAYVIVPFTYEIQAVAEKKVFFCVQSRFKTKKM